MAKLINGRGNPAVYANEDADLIASICGDTTCISAVGSQYAATQEDANTIGLADGVIITKEGRRIQLDEGKIDLFTIPTGTSGVTNYYIIGYKLSIDLQSRQTCETFVQKMDSSSATIPEDTFKGGATEVYVSVYRVIQDGLNIDSINGLLPTLSIGSTSSSHTGTGSSITNTIAAGASIDTVTQTLLNNDHKITNDLSNVTPAKIRKLGTYYDISGLPFTAPKDGFLVITAGYGTSALLELYVNSGATIEFYINGSNTITLPLNAGDIVTSNNVTVSWMYLSFFPYKNS